MPERVHHVSWLNPATLWRARNGVAASLAGDPTNDDRRRWVEMQRDRGVSPDFAIERDDPDTYSFMLLADTGEGDSPQYAVVPGFLRMSERTRFTVLASDVLYPVGSVNEYGSKFFRPYKDYNAPIYAVPGNHDWYDGINGFMRVFCDADAANLPPRTRPKALSASWWRSLLFKRPEVPDEQRLDESRRLRSGAAQRAVQPGPYWMIDSGPLRIIGIDTGLLGGIDKEQGQWLRRVSEGPKPKILVTGSPLYVDNEYHPCAIEGGGTVDEIVSDPRCNYVAAIGGDIHNYQRYPVQVGDRTIQYIVAGGGGAFMHATHTVPKVEVAGVTEQDFRCYPLRSDSLAYYSVFYGRRLRMRRLLELSDEQAAAVISRRLGIAPIRKTDVPVTLRARFVATLLGVPSRPHRKSLLHLPVQRTYAQAFSPSSTSYTPPFFKNFLRFDVTPGGLRIRCFAATGHREQEIEPPVEDDLTLAFD
jgi:hypothetical protein